MIFLPVCKHRKVGVQSDVVIQHTYARTTILSLVGETSSMGRVFATLQRLKDSCLEALSTLVDLGRSKSELIAENAWLRQQLLVLRRQVRRPTFTRTDRILLVLLARLVRTWQQALLLVQPDTLLRWHRELFRLYWKRKSKTASHTPKVAAETIALIRQMATDNRRLRC
jgi:hypothetical protein